MKRLLVVGISFGVGFAITASIIIGGFFLYQSRPKPPKPWNPTAITAAYDHIDTDGENKNFVFYYTLENNTNFDYKISNLTDVVTMAKLKKPNSLSGSPDGKFLKPDYPILIPAKQRLRFSLQLGFPYDKNMKEGTRKEEREQYRKELEAYANKEFSNLDGFVLFDEVNRYQINLPKGW